MIEIKREREELNPLEDPRAVFSFLNMRNLWIKFNSEHIFGF